ncbi:MAG: lipocalin-like domain-containing protein [Candidatus Dormibacteraceae bacterium]
MAFRVDEGSFLDLIGTWRLTAAYFVAQATGDRLDLFGAEPFGYAVLESNGRMIALLTSSGRTPAASSSDMTTLFKSMVAYTRRWSIDGEKLVTKVDGAWDPSWVGTEQVRYYAFDGQTLSIRTAPIEHPSFAGQKVIGYLDWQRDA